MNETVQDLKVETDLVKKTQTEGNLEKENLGTWMGSSEVRLTNRI